MLADILTFQERETSGAGNEVDVDLLRKTMEMLHKDDDAVIKYFGTSRGEFVRRLEKGTEHRECLQHASIEVLHNKIQRIAALSHGEQPCSTSQETFAGFYRAFYCYFKQIFEFDKRYVEVCRYFNAESLLVSVQPYVIACLKRLSQKSLVHCLNTRISQGVDTDLNTFEHFLQTQSISTLLASYPVLTDLLIQQMESTSAYLYKVISHFAKDVDALVQLFALQGRRIDSIDLGWGDPHANGETVCAVQIATTSLVYKPRSNREAEFYGALMRLLHENNRDECFSAHTPSLICRDDHCWIEKVENRACETVGDVALFYRRTGAQIAIAHALNGMDFHYENIIACGSSPVMIDLECLFTASMIDLKGDLPDTSALFKTLKLNGQSIFATGFVPYSPGSENDFSGLTRQKHFTSNVLRLVREQGFYHLKRVSIEKTPIIRHLPVLDGLPRSLEDYQEDIFEGFELAYDEVMKHRRAILALIRQHASELKTRVLIKNTQRYVDFIELTLHPRFMQCMLQRQLLLATLWSELSETLIGKHVPGHESVDLERANIPSFTMPIGSNRLFSGHGGFVAELDIESPLESCRRKLSDLSVKDKAFQTLILRECLFPSDNGAMPLNRQHCQKGVPGMRMSDYLAGALRVAAVIERLSIEGEDGDVAWSFLNTHPTTRRNYLSPMSNSLYSGMGGLAVFYMSLFRVSGQPEHLSMADRIVDSMAKSHEHFDSDIAVSAYFGLASYLYVLVNHQQVMGQDIHRATIDDLLLKLADFPRQDDEFDFLNGWCGTVTILVNLYQLEKRDNLIPLIEKFSAAIQAELLNEEGRFVRKSCRTPLLTGFSHGISGILQALGKAYEVTGNAALVPLIVALLKDENHLKAQGFWLDLRDASKSAHMTKWCHGDAGILISRLQLKKALKGVFDEELAAIVDSDISQCEHNLWHHGLGSGYSLCHGDFGNLVCLLELYRSTGNSQGIARSQQAFSEVADNFFNEDFMAQNSVPVLGIMLGLTGAGQALLCAVEPTLPNVLSLTFMDARPAASVQDHPDIVSSSALLH